MLIKCTYGDLDRVRSGVYQKLWSYTFALAIDGHRTRKFCKVLSSTIGEYEEELVKLGAKYGEPGPNKSFKISQDKLGDYLVAKGALDAVECEVVLVPLPYSTWSQVPMSAFDQDALEKFVEATPEIAP